MSPRLYILKLALTLATLVAMVYFVEWQPIIDAVRHANLGWVVLALALLPANVTLDAYRWHRLVHRLDPDVRYRTSLAAVMSGYPLGLLTPGRVGDYVGRALYLRSISATTSVTLTFVERMFTLVCCLIFGLAALPYFLITRVEVTSLAWISVLTLALFGAAILLVLLLNPSLSRSLLSTAVPFKRVQEGLAILKQFSRRDTTTLFGLSALRYLIFSTQFVVLVHAFAPDAGWLITYTGVVLVFFAKSAIPSITLGDLGIRESAAVFFLGSLGIFEAAAFDASLAIF
ncbi:MAG: lysylphosphatidylglycerol synthase transmembrane domain-containing protein, partial [Rubricoccaceae bacterium]|nr:lysylphosphatidylglycerol synthase transmembrane domain-containing protein [Rubricoccaceae bacterium]